MTKTTALLYTKKSKFALSCSLILLFSGLVYAISPHLIGLLLERQLSNYGISSSSQIEYPSNNRLQLSTAFFKIDTGQLDAQIRVTDLRVEYNLLDLLLRQKVTAIYIDKLNAQLISTAEPPALKESTQMQLFNMLPAALLSKVAIDELKVAKLQLTWDKQPQQQISVNGELLLTPEQIDLQGDYFENGVPLAKLQMSLNTQNQFTISANLTAPPGALQQGNSESYFNVQLQGEIQTNADKLQIKASQKIDFKQFKLRSLWLSKQLNLSQMQQIGTLDAQLQLEHQLDMPHSAADIDNWLSQLQLNSQFDIQITQSQPSFPLAQQTLSASALALNTSGTLSWDKQQLAIALQPSSNILLSDFTSPDAHSAQLRVKLQSALRLAFDNRYQINKVAAFAATIDAAPWSTPVGELTHQPLLIQVQHADLQKRHLAVEFQLANLNLDNSDAQLALPLQRLKTDLSGHFSLLQNSAQLRLNKGLSLEINQLSSAALTVKSPASPSGGKDLYFTEQLKIITDSELNISLNLTDNALKIADTALTLQPGQWHSPVGVITHKAIGIQLSKIDLARKSARLNFDANHLQLQATGLPFKQALLTTAGSLQLSPERIDVSLKKKLKLQLKKFSTAQISSNALNIGSSKAIQLTIPLLTAGANLAKLQLSPVHLHLSGSAVTAAKQKLSYRSISLTLKNLQLAPLRLQLQTKVRGLSLRNNNLFKNITISSTARISNRHYRASYQVNHSHLPLLLKGKIHSDVKFRRIVGDWQLSKFALESTAKEVADLLNLPWPAELQITQGNYLHSGQFELNRDKLEAKVQHKITELALKIADTVARGINISSESQYKNKRLSESGRLDIAEVNSGIAITDISTNFNLSNLLDTNRSMQLDNTQGKMLQGDFTLQRFSTTLDPLQGNSQINFSNLPLNNILALEQNPSLTGSGSLEGKLPFRLSNDQLYIVDGQVKAMDKGYIRYSANDKIRAMADTNSGLKIALSILEDFYYEVLSIKLNYYPDGRLLLENQLAGNNPNWQQGHPIKFSINVEENLLALLKTLQFSSDLEKKLQQQIQKSTQ